MIRFKPLSGGVSARRLGLSFGLSIVVVLLALVCTAPLSAQLTGKGSISGTVADTTGAVIPNATLTATSTGNGLTSKAVSTGAGDYHFSSLDPGIYTVTVVAPGFQKLTQENIHVNAMENAVYNPALQVGAESQEVTVTAEPPQLETTNATLGATMEQQTYSELPVEMGAYGQADQRRATDFVFLMPGVQGNNTNGNPTTNTGVVNGSGSRGAVSDVYIDGIPFVRAGGNGDPRYVWTAISVDAVDQFQLQTTGYSAVYEGQGVMNYSIKQGGAKYHTSIYEFLRNTALDTWGFWGKALNPATLTQVKPVEHSNEYGINIGGPLIPLGSLKNKLFFFTNYNGFRYTSATPTPMTFPTAAEQGGDFSALWDPTKPTKNVISGYNDCSGNPVYIGEIMDPTTQSTYGGVPCRNQAVSNGNANVIPSSEMSTVAKNLQSFLSKVNGIGTSLSNNYIAPNPTGLVNWSTTSRVDYQINSKDTLSVLGAVGRQASSVPVGQTTSGRNVGPLPYNYGQAYAPKTAVWSIEETHIFSPNLINQIKWGYARYNGPTFNPNDNPTYAASSAMGMSGLPIGQASNMFPIVTFAGSNVPTQWNGATENSTIAENYTALDNVQWNRGKHAFTFGGQFAWLLYNVNNATKGGSTPITLAAAVAETSAIGGSSSKITSTSSTGNSYASFLFGQIDKGSFTQYLQQEFGARFRAISGYVQDNWKMTNKLTLDIGIRYDFYPTVREIHNAESFFDPNLTNTITNMKGALNFTGSGVGTCNCSTPVNNFYKNFGPRAGLAYQVDSKTVVRASYGVMFTHGNAVGGLATSIGTLGFSAAPSFSSNSGTLLSTMTGLFAGGNGAIPTYTGASGVASGNAYGTGYTNTANYTGTPSSMTYDDPYYGSRAPEFLNWSVGLQRQLSNKLALTVTYVGSEGHFLQADDSTARGYWSNGLDPKYLLTLGSHVSDTGSAIATDCGNATYGLSCPATALINTKQTLATYLKPFPFQGVTDNFGQYSTNANYNAVQALLALRAWHGLTLNVNYTFSKAIDDSGYFRTGYAIPAGLIYNVPQGYQADRIERSVSTSSQPQHFVTTAVWNTPFGKSILNQNNVERAVLGGFTFSGVYQAFSGSPLPITDTIFSSSNNPSLANASKFTPPSLNPAFTGVARINGRWGKGATLANYNSAKYVDSTAFITTPAYMFGNSPRTAPYKIYGPGNYQLDLALVRTFPLHITESTALKFRAEWYNVTNKTFFAANTTNGMLQWGSTSFGTVTSNGSQNRKALQFSARIEF